MSEKAQSTQNLSPDEYDAQFEWEANAFEAMREQLLEKHEGKFVAVYQGKIIDFDDSERTLFIRVLSKYGVQTPIYFQQVLKEGIPIVDIPGIDID